MRGANVIPAIVLVVSLLAPSQSTGGKGDETKIIALENAWNLAEVHKDAKVLDELLADTLVYVDYDGSFMNKAQFLATTRDTAYRPEQIVNEDVTVHMYDNTAVVTGIYRDKGVDKSRAYVRRGRFTDTWVYHNGLWQCVASQSTLIRR